MLVPRLRTFQRVSGINIMYIKLLSLAIREAGNWSTLSRLVWTQLFFYYSEYLLKSSLLTRSISLLPVGSSVDSFIYCGWGIARVIIVVEEKQSVHMLMLLLNLRSSLTSTQMCLMYLFTRYPTSICSRSILHCRCCQNLGVCLQVTQVFKFLNLDCFRIVFPVNLLKPPPSAGPQGRSSGSQ